MLRERIKKNDYFQIGFVLFLVISASIAVFFLFLRFEFLIELGNKILKILMPIILGLAFAYLLNPLVTFFEKNVFKKFKKGKSSRIMSILVTYILTLVTIILIIRFGIPSLLDSIRLMLENLPIYLNNIYGYLTNAINRNSELKDIIGSLNTNITDYTNNIIAPAIDAIMVNITSGITNFITVLFNCIIGIIVSIYLIYDKEQFLRNFKRTLKALLPKKAYVTTMNILNYSHKIFGGFLIAKIIDSIIIGIITFIILSIFKIPYTLIISIIVGITNVIPYFGPFIGALPSALLLFLIDPAKSITFLILILLIQQFDGNILGPKLIGNKTGIKSFWVLFSILLFGGLFGFIGMIVGVPVFAVIYSLLASYINKKLAKKNL